MSRKNKEAEREERRKKIAANLLAGLDYRTMANALGVSIGTIAADVKILMGRWQKEQVGVMDQIVQLEVTRLDRALNAIWNKILDGDQGAINSMLRIMERRAKLLGLDKPAGLDLTSDGEPITVKIVKGVSMDDL